MATEIVELFACERKKLMAGWGAQYLLPTDKYAYRSRGYKKAWQTIEEAESALLAPGWSWEQVRDASGTSVSWEVDSDGSRCDEDGWIYSTNFQTNYEGSAKASPVMFARWRRLFRTQTFTGPDALMVAVRKNQPAAGAGCQNVDLEAATQIGRLILETLSAASLYGDWCFPTFVQLKTQLIDRLVVGKETQKDTLDTVLASFVTLQRGGLTRVAEAFKGSDDGALTARVIEVDKWLPAIEREAYALLAIRNLRPELACSVADANHDCPLRPVLCTNPGCTMRCSAKDLDGHQQSCRYKLFPCDKCGETIPRGELRAHAAAACPMREASCTFSAIGCSAPLNQRGVSTHLEDCTQSHMMMMLQTMMEQQDVIRSLTARVYELETRCASSQEAERTSQALVTGEIAKLDSKLAALEQRSTKEIKKVADGAADDAKKKADAAGSDARKRADAAAASTQKDVTSLRTDVGGLKASVAELMAMQKELAQLKTSVAPLLPNR